MPTHTHTHTHTLPHLQLDNPGTGKYFGTPKTIFSPKYLGQNDGDPRVGSGVTSGAATPLAAALASRLHPRDAHKSRASAACGSGCNALALHVKQRLCGSTQSSHPGCVCPCRLVCLAPGAALHPGPVAAVHQGVQRLQTRLHPRPYQHQRQPPRHALPHPKPRGCAEEGRQAGRHHLPALWQDAQGGVRREPRMLLSGPSGAGSQQLRWWRGGPGVLQLSACLWVLHAAVPRHRGPQECPGVSPAGTSTAGTRVPPLLPP